MTSRRSISSLTEQEWYRDHFLEVQKRIQMSADNVLLDFGHLQWLDLWPLSQLVKLLYSRLVQRKQGITVVLPFDRSRVNADGKNKPLSFLVDIGFVHLVADWQGTFRIAGSPIRIRPSADSSSGLSDETRSALEKFGYHNREYKDKIVLPFTIVSAHDDVDILRDRLWRYVDSFFRYYEREIAESCLIDTFFRELTENAIEHSQDEKHSDPAFVVARLIRSVWDLPDSDPRRDKVLANRSRGKLLPMRRFLQSHQNEGFVEMIVVDSGPGIQGTVAQSVPPKFNGVPGIYEWVMTHDASRFEKDYRLKRGKSPLTGLVECANCLEQLPAILIFREETAGAYIESSTKRSAQTGLALQFRRIMKLKSERTTGCNVQFAMAIHARARRGRHVGQGQPTGVEADYCLCSCPTPQSRATVRSESTIQSETRRTTTSATCALVDISDFPEDKDTAWHVVQKLASLASTARLPIVLVGVTDPLVARLSAAIAEFNKVAGLPQDRRLRGWLGLSASLNLYYIGTETETGAAAVNGVVSGRCPKPGWGQKPEDYFGIAHHDGSLVISAVDMCQAWRRGIEAELTQLVQTPEADLLKGNLCVELPNGQRVQNYLDVHSLLRSPLFRQLLTKASRLAVGMAAPQLVICYLPGVRQFCAELLGRYFPGVLLVDFPDPYSPAASSTARAYQQAERVLLFGDAVHTGGHANRVIRSCHTLGISVTDFIATLDSHPSNSPTPKLPVPWSSLVRWPFTHADGTTMPAARVDPHSLCLRPIGEGTSTTEVFRTSEEGAEYYNFMERQKALLDIHCLNYAGHHFAVAIDFRQIVRPDSLNYLIGLLRPHATRAAAIVYPEDSVIGAAATSIADRLKVPRGRVIPCLLTRRISKEFMFGPEAEIIIRQVAEEDGVVLFIDDAFHHGRVLSHVATSLGRLGVRRLKAWFILDNSPPGYGTLASVQVPDAGTVVIKSARLFRSFFPAHNTALSCPHCRLGECLRTTIKAETNDIISDYLRQRVEDLRPVNARNVLLDPWRYLVSSTTSIPEHRVKTGIPATVRSQQALEMALLEMSQFEEGILAIVNSFCGRELPQKDVVFAWILSGHVPTIDKLGRTPDFFATFHRAVRESQGETTARLLEAALLWPLEHLLEQSEALVAAPNDGALCTDSGLALIYAIVRRTIEGGKDAERSKVLGAIQNRRNAMPDKSILRALLASLEMAMEDHAEPWTALRESLVRLAKALLLHRAPHHRILYHIGTLTEALRPETVEGILGITSDANTAKYLTAMLCLGNVEKAISTLIRLGELEDVGNVSELRTTIRKVLHERAELRDLWLKTGAPRHEDIERRCDDIRFALDRIRVLVRTETTAGTPDDIIEYLRCHLFQPCDGVMSPLYDAFRAHGQPKKITPQPAGPESVPFPNEDGRLVLADAAVITSVAVGIATNTQKHTPDGLFVTPRTTSGSNQVITDNGFMPTLHERFGHPNLLRLLR